MDWKKLLSRKFIMTLILSIILLIVFFVMIKNDLMDSIIFGAWLAGLLANFGIYTEGNIRIRKRSNNE